MRVRAFQFRQARNFQKPLTMKIEIPLMLIILMYGCGGQTNTPSTTSSDSSITSGTYKIILRTYTEPMEEDDSLQLPGDIETNTVENLKEPLKGLTAFYSALGGSYCSNDSCDLTTALGLGKQGSNAHKKIIKKYLPNDSVAELLIRQDCYLRPDGASSFNAYEYLTILVVGDTIKADYNLWSYDHGDIKCHKKLDIYVYTDSTFKKVKRDDTWTYPE
jgi:hypothetical protein